MSKLSERIEKLRLGYKARYSDEMFHYRRKVFDRAMSADGSRIVRQAYGLKEFLETKPVDLTEDDILAGHGQFLDWTYSNPEFYEEVGRLKEKIIFRNTRHLFWNRQKPD